MDHDAHEGLKESRGTHKNYHYKEDKKWSLKVWVIICIPLALVLISEPLKWIINLF